MIHGLKPSLAEGGKIKIGGRGESRPSASGGTYRMPRKDDHFTITTTRRDGAGDLIVASRLMGELQAAGYASSDGKLRAIPIVLHSDEIDEVFPTAYVAYHGKRLHCKGDGKTATRREIADGVWTGREAEVECPCAWLDPDDKGARRCKPSGTLHCSIRVPGQAVAGSVYRWRTTSIISIQQMIGSLIQIQQTVGVIQGLPLVLRVRPVSVNPVGGKASEVYCCHVELRAADLQTVQRQALELAQMRQSVALALHGDAVPQGYRAMLAAPGDEPDDEQQEVADEYYPDAVIDALPGDDLTDSQRAMLQTPTAAPPNYHDKMQPVDNPGPPPAPKPADDGNGKGRTRRTRCSGCGELFGPGVVKDGKCPACAAPPEPEPEPVEPDPAPEIVTRPPARPSTATTTAAPVDAPVDAQAQVRSLILDAIQVKRLPSTKVLDALRARFDGFDDPTRQWSIAEVAEVAEVLGGLA